ALLAGLDDYLCTQLILLAHWKSQSFFEEMYTDLFDFCFCLKEGKEKLAAYNNTPIVDLADAADEVIAALTKEPKSLNRRSSDKKVVDKDKNVVDKLVVASAFAGPDSQYSHGLSVYFPWSAPSVDSNVLENYARYRFSHLAHSQNEGEPSSWLD